MWEVQEVLRRLDRGESQVHVATATGRDRKTVRHYLRLAAEFGWRPGDGEPDESLAVRILERLRPGAKEDERGESEQLLFPHRDQIQRWLGGSEGERGRNVFQYSSVITEENTR